jgi:hypothetical protein
MSRVNVFSLSMAVTWFLAFIPMAMLEQREIARLPVSRREFWIVRCWLSTAIPAGISAITLSLAAFASPALALDAGTIALATFYSFVYGGCFLAGSIAFKPAMGGGQGMWGTVRMLLVIFGFVLGGCGWPFLFAQYLPHSFAEFGGPMRSVVIAALGITVAAFLYYPPIVARASRPTMKRKAPAPSARRSTRDSLTGLPFMFWREARKALLLNGVMAAIAISYWWIFESGPWLVGHVISLPSLADFLNQGGALMFADPSRNAGEHFPLIIMFLVMTTSDVGTMGEMRRLRTLPLSSTQLAVALSGLSVVTTIMLWIALLGLHIAALGNAPYSLRPDLFLTLSGSIALWLAVRLVFARSSIIQLAAPFFAGTMVAFPMFLAQPHALMRTAMMISGAAALVLSVLITRRALRRGSRIYKGSLQPTIFGTPPTQGTISF